MMPRHYILSIALLAVCLGARAEEPVSFRTDVMAILSKSGCNMGACHGNANGKGGFKLSLRGQDPAGDYLALAREQGGRRLNPIDPAASLLLAKPSLALAHEGGRRFKPGSWEYEVLSRWIVAGAPDDTHTAPQLTELQVSPRDEVVWAPSNSAQLAVTARFSDGVTRDVTTQAVYEAIPPTAQLSATGTVTAHQSGEVLILVRYLDRTEVVRLAFLTQHEQYVWTGPAPANYVDESLFAKQRRWQLNPAPLANDETFVRRAYLDIIGRLPLTHEARDFIADAAPDKRAQLIDALLKRPEFAEFWALKWSDVLHIEEKTLDRKGVQAFHHWVRDQLATERPLNEWTADILSASGSTYLEPATNYYRALRDPTARGEAAAQTFLGARLQCARCHNHPFDRWTQDDFFGWGAVFASIDYKVLENDRRDTNDKHEFDGEQIVWRNSEQKLKNPRTRRPAPPQLLGTSQALPADQDPLDQLAAWIAADPERRFARAQANRIWFHLMGRGLVEPVDDIRPTNPATHPELLTRLGDDLAAHQYNLKHLIRTICNSHSYQLSTLPGSDTALAESVYATTLVRRLPAETLLDAVSQVFDVPVKFNGYPTGLRATQIPGVQAVRSRDKKPSSADGFLAAFGKPPRLLSCECERNPDTTLSQAFQLVSGELLSELLTDQDNRLSHLLSAGEDDGVIVDELFWAALTRAPSPAEREAAVAQLISTSDRRATLEDLAWALVTSQEFVLRH
jgi:hypothetical protein